MYLVNCSRFIRKLFNNPAGTERVQHEKMNDTLFYITDLINRS